MTALKKAIIKSYDAGTHSAAVQIAGSLAVWLEGLPVATDIPAAEVQAGRSCSVLFLDDSNPADALVLEVHGAVPSAGGGVSDHDLLNNLAYAVAGHTGFVASGGVAGGQTIQGGTAASENLDLESTAHATKGEVRIKDGSAFRMMQTTGHVIGGAIGQAYIGLRVRPSEGTVTMGNYYGVSIEPQIAPDANYRTYYGIQGSMLIVGSPARTNTGVYGLTFTAFGYGNLSGPILAGCYARPATQLMSGTWSQVVGLQAGKPIHVVPQGGSITETIAVHAQDYGTTMAATVYGLKVDDITAGTTRYLIEALSPTAGVPCLRVVAGNPAANLSQMWIAVNNGAVVLRQVGIGPANSAGSGFRYLRVLN